MISSDNSIIGGHYQVLRILGKGSTGKVMLVNDTVKKEHYAIKYIKKSHFDSKQNIGRKIYREIALMKLMDHPHILRLHDVQESERNIYMILEYAKHGELFDYLVNCKQVREDLAMDLFRQIIYALEYMHLHKICHRDLKPENILLDHSNRIKLADFGFARWMKDGIAETSCGSPHYAAPEVVKGGPYDGCTADVWSAGVIFFALLTGYLPFDDASIKNLLIKVKRGKFIMPKHFPDDIKDLIKKMLTVEPEKRITIAEIKEHKAFLNGYPKSYVLPSPIPIPDLEEPLSIDDIPDSHFESLCQLGISRDEARDQLTSAGTNVSKVFVNMLLQNQEFENLPWNEAVSALPECENDEFFLTEGFGQGMIDNSGLASQWQQEHDSFAPGRFSLTKPMYLPSATREEYEAEETFEQSCVSLPVLFANLQKILIENSFVFFHPNDVTLIAKNRSGSYVKITALFEDENTFNLTLYVQNDASYVMGLLKPLIKNAMEVETS